ncbi:hypothetical protein METUNv1_01816 [Methyloversatilis universalis FAM5]|uniref:Uncharacterized protein n=1 Tax=Methyloversatilis universalis (strain ATCC BAA-1314 / DSM 25237 / JCM 13912 / CCUG 52030 / FAM5) TaxID=1000565 RepID=F5RBL6_METUF|nr:hypothetical protein METUNv1_01816 [Methyloversatilis universalis FAM5]
MSRAAHGRRSFRSGGHHGLQLSGGGDQDMLSSMTRAALWTACSVSGKDAAPPWPAARRSLTDPADPSGRPDQW